MEIEPRSQETSANSSSPSPMIPQKRKNPPGEVGYSTGAFSRQEAALPPSSDTQDPESTAGSQLDKDEYETGRVLCEACGEGVPIRDGVTGAFTVKHWDAHRMQCPNASHQAVRENSPTPEPQPDPTPIPQSSVKKRRAKRSEEERIAYLRDDPYVAQFEAYRVLCASCDKWIRLRPNSTYCSIPWDAHRKSCLAKRVAKNSHPTDDRSGVFSADPNVRKFDSERVQCKQCDEWVHVGPNDNPAAVQKWTQHRAACSRNTPSSSAAPAPSAPVASNRPTIDSVPPPSKHLMAMVSSSALPNTSTSNLARVQPSVPVPAPSPSVYTSAFKDLTPGNFVPSQESRRRNAEQREAFLRSDPLISEVEPNRVFCSICRKWVQLRQDSTYCAYPWLQHRGKCLNRFKKKLGKDVDTSEVDPELQKALEAHHRSEGDDLDDSEEGESESADDEDKMKRRSRGRDDRRKVQGMAPRMGKEEEYRKNSLTHKFHLSALAEDEASMDVDVGYSARLADLDTPHGRFEFVARSVRYLFRTTYEPSDELTIATLMAYLNAAMPPDKHEDFDTTEVTKAAMAASERGEYVLEGDVIRIRG